MARPIALAMVDGVGAAIVPVGNTGAQWLSWPEAVAEIIRLDRAESPRWVWWPGATPRMLAALDVRPARCWDLGAVHRMVVGGWQSSPSTIWAACHGLDPADAPGPAREPDLFSDHSVVIDRDEPFESSGHLRAEWVTRSLVHDGDPSDTSERTLRWAELGAECFTAQQAALDRLPDPTTVSNTAHSESAAELICGELERDGLPLDVEIAEALIASYVGPRPADASEAAALAAARDELVLRHIPAEQRLDLRNPANVKALLRRVGIEVADTRAWRLEDLRAEHPFVDELLAWRKAERILTTFGYGWLDAHVGSDGRLRGSWSGSDGAAGRMTATAGLHNMPADLRAAVVAEPGRVFIRADLGQIEPRILAAVSGDPALTAATHDADMYAPVAVRLGVIRDVAKVAVLGAMYGQTTGRGAEALSGLEVNYPIAMRYLADATRAAEGGNDLRTRGGRLVRMGTTTIEADRDMDARQARSRAAARGRYGRNAMVQGAAAEFFKTWAAVVRARLAAIDDDARIVLCLHDELLLHVPDHRGHDAARLVNDALDEAAHRWLGAAAGPPVRFVADVSVIARWSDAK